MRMLIISRKDLAANLAAYGEAEASAKVADLTPFDYERVCKIGFDHSLRGEKLLRAACLAAIEVIEGKSRDLRRSRRINHDVPAELREPDPRALAIEHWIAEYSEGEFVKKDEIFETLSAVVAPELPSYRYYKSYGHFRGKSQAGTSCVGFERGHAIVSLRFGVTLTAVEQIKRKLLNTPIYGPEYIAATISKYSVNMGPNSKHWHHPVPAQWPIVGSDGLARACPEVVSFVRELVVPYLQRHQNPANIRDTLLSAPGRADQFAPVETIFAVDYLLRRRDWLDADFLLLQHRLNSCTADVRERLQRCYFVAASRWDDPR